VMILQVGLLVREVCSKPLSHAGDGAIETTLVVARCHRRVMLAMVLPRQLGRGAMSVPSHAGDGATEATWPQRDISVESCWP
jgi:hypothetical protein